MKPIKQPVIPMLVYEDVEAAQNYLVKVFGFERGALERADGGLAVHAEVHVKDFVIWMHRVLPEHGLASARSLPAVPGGLVVYVDDVDAHYDFARRNGATIDSVPADQPYGQREYAARDLEGLRWYFATRKT